MGKKTLHASIGAGFGLCFLAQTVLAEGSTTSAALGSSSFQFGGPDAVPSQLRNDVRQKDTLTGRDSLLRYRDWKERLREGTGFSYTLDYTTAGLLPSSTMSGRGNFTSGAVRFYGQWELVGRGTPNTGTFVRKVENRMTTQGHPPAPLPGMLVLQGRCSVP